jgi:hypothetical protein
LPSIVFTSALLLSFTATYSFFSRTISHDKSACSGSSESPSTPQPTLEEIIADLVHLPVERSKSEALTRIQQHAPSLDEVLKYTEHIDEAWNEQTVVDLSEVRRNLLGTAHHYGLFHYLLERHILFSHD